MSSQVPVHSVLVQKSVTTITNAAGRLSELDARESSRDAQGAGGKKLALGLPTALRIEIAFPLDNALEELDFALEKIESTGLARLIGRNQKAARQGLQFEWKVTLV